MTTVTTGLFFLRQQRAVEHDLVGEQFRLTLRVIDRQGPGKAEPYVVTWTGPAAAMWFNEHQAALTPGRPLNLELHNPRSYLGLRAPETHATVVRCALAPLAPSWNAHNTNTAHSA